MLEFAINGQLQAADLEAVEEAGYEVEFQTSAAVLVDDDETKTAATTTNTTGLLDDSTLNTDSTFDYKVVISLDDEVVAESELQTVTVEEKDEFVAITSYEIQLANDVVVTSGKVALNDRPTIENVEGTMRSGAEEQAIASFDDVTSSNNNVALVNNDGEIVPVGAGNVTITIEKDEATYDIILEVVADSRKLDSVVSNKEEIKLYTGAPAVEVELSFEDQYGDAYILADDILSFDEVKVGNKDDGATLVNANTNLGAATLATNGLKASLTFNVSTETAGQGTLVVKDSDDNWISIKVYGSNDSVVASRVLETEAESNQLDLYAAHNEDTKISIDLVYNTYNAAGYLVGAETNIGTDSERFVVSLSNTDVANLAVDSNGKITISAVEEGKTTVRIHEGALLRASYEVVAVSTAPVIDTLEFDEDAKIITTSAYALSNVIDELKDEKGNDLFITIDGEIQDDSTNEFKVGEVTVTSADFTVDIDDGEITHNATTGQEGLILVRVYDINDNLVGSFVLEVEIPSV